MRRTTLRHRAGDSSAPPPRVTLFEADERLGGKIRTSPFAGLPAVDEGADAFLARVPWAVDLAHELGLDDLVSPATGRAYVWWDGSLHAIPEGLVLGVPAGIGSLARSHLLSWPGKARAALEPLVRRGHPAADNLGALIEHRFGAEVLDRLVDPLIGSINAGDTRQLSLAASAPQVATGLDRSRSLLLGLRKGRAATPAGPGLPRAGPGHGGPRRRAPSSALDGVEVVTGQPVEVLERRAGGGWVVQGTEVDAVILALPAYEAARLLAGVSPGSAALLGAISYVSVAMVTLALPEAAVGHALDGSGHLVPKPVQRTLTAASWASTKWTHWHLPGQVVVRASVGRWGDDHAVELDDGDLVEAVMADLERHLGVDGGPHRDAGSPGGRVRSPSTHRGTSTASPTSNAGSPWTRPASSWPAPPSAVWGYRRAYDKAASGPKRPCNCCPVEREWCDAEEGDLAGRAGRAAHRRLRQ